MEKKNSHNIIFANLLSDWLSIKYFKTFKITEQLKNEGDFLITQRDKKMFLSVHTLWNDGDEVMYEIEKNINSKNQQLNNANIIWPPEKSDQFLNDNKSVIVDKVTNGIKGLDFGDYREIRIPIEVTLSKTEDDGAYMAISGGLSKIWTKISGGVKGVFQLDGRNYDRLPSELAEEKIIIEKIQEASKLLNTGEASFISIDEYWPINNVTDNLNENNKIILATGNKTYDPKNGPIMRKRIRDILNEFTKKDVDTNKYNLSILFLINSSKKEDDVVSSSLKGINPKLHENIDMIIIVNAGLVSILKKNEKIDF
ncbi:MAG: hypothetical protein P8J51_04205 [Dehalococcoidia bacterium]|nr:hypothetical protein [Dehalococcoidia bacterium]